MGILPARPCPIARLSLERGRHRRHLRSQAGDLPRADAVERAGPDPEGALLRPHRPRGQPRRGRQGVLLLPRLDADPFLHADAVQVPAAGLPVRRTGRAQSRPHARRARVRADRHRHLRRPPLLRRHGRIRQGRRGRPADADHHRQPRPRGRAAARAADGVVPQHVVVVLGRGEARTAGASADGRGLGAAGRDAAVRHALRVLRGAAAAAVHRERDQHPPPVRRPRRPGLPQGRDQRFPGAGRHGRDQRRRRRHQGGSALRDRRARRRRARDPRPVLAHRAERERLCRLRGPARHAQGRSRRVLRHDHPGASLRRRSRRHATEPGRPAVEQAVLPLRRQDLAGGRPGAATATEGRRARRAQCRVGAPVQRRRHLDARHVGVPVVRGVGSRVPLCPAGTRRRRLRQAPAAADAARVVHAPERAAAGLRVELQRRQPAGARVGGLARVRDRAHAHRRRRPRLPASASSTSCC